MTQWGGRASSSAIIIRNRLLLLLLMMMMTAVVMMMTLTMTQLEGGIGSGVHLLSSVAVAVVLVLMLMHKSVLFCNTRRPVSGRMGWACAVLAGGKQDQER